MTIARHRLVVAAASLAFVLLGCPEVRAESPTGTLRDFLARVNKILAAPELDGQPTERLVAVRKLVSGLFDFREAAERALGREWHARTAAEQEEFVELFADLLERAYVLRVASKASANAGLTVRFFDESVDGDAATVRTAVGSRDGGEILLDYHMIKRGERWMIRDVVLEHVSLVANYRAQFHRVIQGSSYPALVAQMKAKSAAAPRGAPVPAESALIETAVQRPPRIEDTPPVALSESRVGVGEPATVADTRPAAGPAPLPPATTRGTATSYWVQVGAFRSPEAAGRLTSRLREENLVLSPGPERIVRVRVGPFPDRAAARSKLLELRTKGYRPFIAEERE